MPLSLALLGLSADEFDEFDESAEFDVVFDDEDPDEDLDGPEWLLEESFESGRPVWVVFQDGRRERQLRGVVDDLTDTRARLQSVPDGHIVTVRLRDVHDASWARPKPARGGRR